MKLDASVVRYLTAVEWRVLVAVEMGMKNHDVVPVVLIARIANLRRHGIQQILKNLLKHKLLAHDRSVFDGYKLTYLGYDFLALRAMAARTSIQGIGMRIGVGKESDVHICQGLDNRLVILKLHRLGRISFRSVKKNRDYLGHRQSASWMYLARLAAAKEFAYMKALYEHGFPVPEPIDLNRHAIVMGHIDARPLAQVRSLDNPDRVLEQLMCLIVRFAESGLIHGDFNAFNLLFHEDESITVIDFPQIVGVHHPDAEYYFDRDVQCIRSLFATRFGIDVTEYPKFKDVRLPPVERSLSRFNARPEDEEKRLREEFERFRHEQETDSADLNESSDESCGNETIPELEKDVSCVLRSTLRSLTGISLSTPTNNHDIDSCSVPTEARRLEVNDDRVRSHSILTTATESHSSNQQHPPNQPLSDPARRRNTACSSSSREDNRTTTTLSEATQSENDTDSDAGDTSDTHDTNVAPKRLDNVWTPIVRRHTSKTAKKHAASEEKKATWARGNAGRKRNRGIRQLRDQLRHDW